MTLDAESRQLLQDSAREWFAEACPITQFRAHRDRDGTVCGQEHWSTAVALGWPSILIPEQQGGGGLGMTEMGLILEQAGRNLAPLPLLSTAVIGVTALARAGGADALLQAIVAGDATLALAIDEGRRHNPAHCAVTASKTDQGWILNGRKLLVADAGGASHLLVNAELLGNGSIGLFLVESASVAVEPLQLIDRRDYANVTFEQLSVPKSALLESGARGLALLEAVLNYARVGAAAEMLGSAWAAFEMTVEYLKIREQFGQLVGSFQALQHRAAHMYAELELAQCAVDAALTACDQDDPDLAAIACKAKALANEAFHLVSNEAVQLHGGIGMTDEHDAGLFLKRARVLEQLYGTTDYLRGQFASLRGF